MKKLLLAVALLITMSASAQSVYNVINVTISTYSVASQKWIYGEPTTPDNMKIIIIGNMISVTDAVNSNYRTGKMRNEVDNDEKLKYSWDATDEKGRPVYLSMMVYKKTDNAFLTIMYDLPNGDYRMYSYYYTK